MSRFANLEFDDAKQQRRRAEADAGSPARDATHFYGRGQQAWLNGDFEVALREFSRSLEQHSAFYEGWFGQVRMLIELGEFEEALLWTDKALELFPEHPSLLAAKAVAWCRAGALDKALAYSDNAISQKGAGPTVWLARAEVMFARRSSTAEHCLRNAVNTAGTSVPMVRLEAGRLLLRAGKYLAAMDHLRQASADLPKSALLWLEIGRGQVALGVPEAETTLTQCLTLRPGWGAAKRALERYRRRGLFGRLRGLFRRSFGG